MTAQTIFGSQNIISATTEQPRTVFAKDLDGDNDADVLSTSGTGDKIVWFENTNGKGLFGPEQIILDSANLPYAAIASDLDGDGDQDIVAVVYYNYNLVWFENSDGAGSFGPPLIIATLTGPTCVFAGDIDNDGDQDLVTGNYDTPDKVSWFRNTDGSGTFSSENIISGAVDGPMSVYASDLDGDGDLDVLSASFNDSKLAWYENTDGNGTFGTQHVISTIHFGGEDITTGDMDGDGDQDVVTASFTGALVWYENTDGNGAFSSFETIDPSNAGSTYTVFVADLDNDSDMDILSAFSNTDRVVWCKNWDSNGYMILQPDITSNVHEVNDVFAADIDGDGDLDALSASYGDHKIAWYENLTVVGLNASEQKSLSVYPSPANDLIQVNTYSDPVSEIHVSDLSGKILIEITSFKSNNTINVADIESGLYFISVITENGSFTSTFVKE